MKQAREGAERAPFWTPRVTLGRVAGGEVTYTHAIGEKESALRRIEIDRPDEAVYFVAWTGAHRTDIFVVTAADVERWLAERAR